ncbi:MAG: hypothetical protein ABIZ70_07395 [Gemmatimonadales bacterium]
MHRQRIVGDTHRPGHNAIDIAVCLDQPTHDGARGRRRHQLRDNGAHGEMSDRAGIRNRPLERVGELHQSGQTGMPLAEFTSHRSMWIAPALRAAAESSRILSRHCYFST